MPRCGTVPSITGLVWSAQTTPGGMLIIIWARSESLLIKDDLKKKTLIAIFGLKEAEV